MFRTFFVQRAAFVRGYASAPGAKATDDVFIKNLLDKVKTIKDQPSGVKTEFIKPSSTNGAKNVSGNRPRQNNNNRNRSRSNNNNNNNNNNKNLSNNRNNRNRGQRSKFSNSNSNSGAQDQGAKFSGAEYAKKRRSNNQKRYGQAGFIDSESTTNNFRRRSQPQGQSIFAASKTGTRISPIRRNRTRNVDSNSQQGQAKSSVSEEVYVPAKPQLSELIRHSSNLAFSQEARLTRAVMQVFKRHYRVPDLYNAKADLLDQGRTRIIAQPLSTYPYSDKLPLSNHKVFGPTIIDLDFDYDVFNKAIDQTVLGKYNDLKIEVTKDDAKLKLNAQVVQNALNGNVFFNYSGRKEKIYKACTGLEPVKSLLQ